MEGQQEEGGPQGQDGQGLPGPPAGQQQGAPAPGGNPPPAGPAGQAIIPAGAAYWGPIFDWLSEDPEVAAWLTQAQKDILLDEQANELPAWAAAMVYQGFDIKRIVKLMIARSNAYMADQPLAQINVEVKVNGRNVPFTYSNHQPMTKDVEMIIFLFAERGNTVTKIVSKSIPAIATIMDWMTEKYELDVVPHDPGTPLEPEVITISRIVSCFPMKLCEYFHRGYGNALYKLADVGITNPPVGFSRAILSPHLVSMVPRQFIHRVDMAHCIFFLAHVRVDLVIHRKSAKFTSLKDLCTYYSAEYNTPISNQLARRKFFRVVQYTIGRDDVPNAAFDGAGRRAYDALRALVGDDPNFEQVMEDLNRLDP